MKSPSSYSFLTKLTAIALCSGATVILNAATLTWDADQVTTGIQDGDGTWTAASTNFWDGTTNRTPVKGTDANINIGNGTGGYTITIDNGGALLNYNDGTNGSTLTFNNSYTLAGKVAGDGLAIGNININNASTVATISAQIGNNGLGGTKTWNINSGSTLNVSGGGIIQNISGTGIFQIQGGTWTQPGVTWGSANNQLTINQSAGSVTGGNFKIGTGLSSTSAFVNFNLSGGTETSTGAVSIGSSTGSANIATAIGSASLTISGTGALNITNGSKLIVGGGGGGNGTTPYGANGTLNVTGGSVTMQAVGNSQIFLATNESSLGATHSELNVSGGTVSTNGVQFGDGGGGMARTFGVGSTAAVIVTGGTVNVGSNGITINNPTTTNLTRTIQFGGGTIGAYGADWSSQNTLSIELTGTNGNTTFRASDTDVGATARNITLNSTLFGAGGLIKTGGGTLTLTAANTYAGPTIISAGSVVTSGSGTLGSGNVTVAFGASLTMATASFGDLATLTFDRTSLANSISLASGTDTIGNVYDSFSGTYLAAGLYSAGLLNSTLGTTVFTGGSLLVSVSAIPEPSTYAAILGLVVLGGAAYRRRLVKKAV